MDKRFKCLKCGKCCHEIENKSVGIYKRIPLYPEEADLLENIARDRNIPLKMIEDLVFPDIKNKKVLVVTWRIILEPEGVCPFYRKESGCTIHDKKPLACKAYPIALKRVDAFNMKMDIDPLCPYTEKSRSILEQMDFMQIQEIYDVEFEWAKKMLKRNQKVIMKIRSMEYRNQIEIPRKIAPEDYNRYLQDWKRVIIK